MRSVSITNLLYLREQILDNRYGIHLIYYSCLIQAAFNIHLYVVYTSVKANVMTGENYWLDSDGG